MMTQLTDYTFGSLMTNLTAVMEAISAILEDSQRPLVLDWYKHNCGECGYWAKDCLVVRGVRYEHGTQFDKGCRRFNIWTVETGRACPDIVLIPEDPTDD